MADVRIRSGRNRAQTGWEPRRTYESEDDSADAVDFGNSEDSDGSYSSGEEEEDVIGAQPADYSSLELLQQLRENVRGAARVRGSSQNSTRENSQRERSQRQDSQLERSQRENSQVDNSQQGRRPRGGLLRTTKGVRRDVPSPGVRVYTNPTAESANPQRRLTRRRGQRTTQLEGTQELEEIEDLARVDPPLSTQPRGGSGSRIDRHGGSRQRRRTGLWTDDQLRDALNAVDDGMSMRKAANAFKIPYSSFREWCHGIRRTRKKGPPTVLSTEEEEELVKYLIEMCDRGYGLSPTALRMKVYEITQSRWTPFRNGIPGNGWMRWWKRRHPDLTLRVSQALESARAKGLCEENVRSFFENLQHLYSMHEYQPDRIWNCDESGGQAGRNGGAIVIARRGARRVHSIVPNQREWLSVLVCINAAGSSIPSFYIFRGRRFRHNYIEKCEPGATMAMQQKAWMTSYLFSAWISHFIASVRRIGAISPVNRHLLILDGHNSHITLDVVREASAAGIFGAAGTSMNRQQRTHWLSGFLWLSAKPYQLPTSRRDLQPQAYTQ
jgi:hypothetical protein